MASFFGFLYFFCCYSTILAGYFVLYCHIILSLFVSNKLYRFCTDHFFTYWQYYATALLELVMGCEIEVTGDHITADELSILVMNHRTRTDWNFLWPALYHAVEGERKFRYSTKFMLKDAIKHIPGPGWVMQLTLSIFLKRCWIFDKKILEKFCDYVTDLSYKCSVLMFPEGTDFTEETKQKSDDYALKNNFKMYKHVLHPRTTGFSFLANKLMEEKCLDAVYDMTIFYPDIIPQNENILLRGNFPKKIKVHIKRHSVVDLPKTEEKLKIFLEDLWADKEDLLQKFHDNPNFRNGKILKCDDAATLPIALIFWNSLLVVCVLLFMYDFYFRILCIFHTLLLIFANVLFQHGFQSIEIKLSELKKKILGYSF